MDAATQVLTSIAVILLIGLLLSLISKKLRVSNILLLIIAGLVLGQMDTFSFDSTFLVAIAVLTLVMVVFDGSSRFEIRKVDKASMSALKLTMAFVALNMVVITVVASMLFFPSWSVESILFALLFAIVVSGTDPGSVFIMLKTKMNRVTQLLEVEAIINTPVMVILPFIIFDIVHNLSSGGVANALLGQVVPLMQQLIVGVGSGVLMGLIVFRSMKKFYSQQYSPVAVITAALLSYIIAENLQGNGVLSVATLGLLFGNSYVKEKASLQEFNSMLNSSLIILVFVLIGLIVKVEYSSAFMLKAFLLFIVLAMTRFAAIAWSLQKDEYSIKEKVFMSLCMPKGIAVAVVAFSLSVLPLSAELQPMVSTVLQLIVIFMVYSLVFSSVIDKFSYWFIRIKLDDDK